MITNLLTITESVKSGIWSVEWNVTIQKISHPKCGKSQRVNSKRSTKEKPHSLLGFIGLFLLFRKLCWIAILMLPIQITYPKAKNWSLAVFLVVLRLAFTYLLRDSVKDGWLHFSLNYFLRAEHFPLLHPWLLSPRVLVTF
jgi:hypothetical protein